MKDRKKSVSKRPTLGEDCPLTPTIASNQGRVSVNDNRAIKLVLVDSKNIQKGPGKSSLKRNVSMGINHGICKGDSTIMKSARQRRKSGDYLFVFLFLIQCFLSCFGVGYRWKSG